ncbi:hypothetical protein CPC08DRAFT_823410 [Agrocybe pediades]|nr:hypothetical protein CPC08DRAFT_823410 [Agrocybe pediades]
MATSNKRTRKSADLGDSGAKEPKTKKPRPEAEVFGPPDSPPTNTTTPPRRSKRTPKPKANVAPITRKRRTKEEMQASAAAAAAAKQQAKDMVEAKQREMERMNAEDKLEKKRSLEHSIRRLSDVEEECEIFAGYDEVSSTSSEESEVEEQQDLEIDESRTNRPGQNGRKNKYDSDKPRTRTNTSGGKTRMANSSKEKDLAFASGLVHDWKTRQKAEPRSQKKRNPEVVIQERGLNDDDADATNPFTIPTTQGTATLRKSLHLPEGRDFSRQNKLVFVVSESDSDSENCIPQPIRRRGKKPASGNAARKTTPTNAPLNVRVKLENNENSPPHRKLYTETKRTSKQHYVINTNNVRVGDLPDFAQDSTWRHVFLPTLYDKLFSSSDPFSDFLKGGKAFLLLLQATLHEVYPTIQYNITKKAEHI